MAEVSVLVAAYNSALYLDELLRSVLGGSFRDIEVLVRDDGSSDGTERMVRAAAEADLRVKPVEKKDSKRGAKENFFALMGEARCPYVMFCDADDVWLPDKIELTIDRMREAERAHGAGTPILVHTDLAVADADLNLISPSLFAYEKLSPERSSLKNLLCQNNVTGCTVMINRPLLRMAESGGGEAVMHDWWLALIAAAFGKIEVVRRSTALYRQHGSNEVGAYDAGSLGASAARLLQKERRRGIYDAMFRQADAFAETFRDRLTPEQYAVARAYGGMLDLPKPKKIGRIIRFGFYKNTLLRNIGQFLTV